MQKNIITGAVVIGVVAFVAITYQSMVLVPQNKIDAQERQYKAELLAEERAELQKEARRERAYNSCLSTAMRNYRADWENQCELDGLEENCSLPKWKADWFDVPHAKDKEACVSLYKAG